MGKQIIIKVEPFTKKWALFLLERNKLIDQYSVELGDINNHILQPEIEKVLFWGNKKYTDKLIQKAKNAEFLKYKCQRIIFEQKEG